MRVLEWYRVDQSRRIRRVLVAGAVLLTLGGVVVGGAFLTRQRESTRNTAVMIGLLMTVVGAVQTVVGMWRALAVDAFVVARTDGVEVALDGASRVFAWT